MVAQILETLGISFEALRIQKIILLLLLVLESMDCVIARETRHERL